MVVERVSEDEDESSGVQNPNLYDVTSGHDDVTSGLDLCELRGHVTFRDRSLLIGIVH